ncbi:aldose epimerase [Robbsia sp. Bb-Pol-6]|uniref:Aldose epimerase n=1 Tax=Robbsia betulipollinis TaxID=2981849 RepID=A0ABT3ZPK8_9BURK|nr:aldose epimerase [Robbsia betulipollinis]MCY0388476.1 aldose epimerase [Robbsia betulipollinis]
MRFTDPDIIELGDARSALWVAPRAGGRLLCWRLNGHDVIYWPTQFDLSAPARIRGGNPLLFPFIGRHRVGATPNQWQDAAGAVHALPQHGFARDLPFDATVSADRQAVEMTLTSDARTHAGYPFDFTFSAHYRLDGNALTVTLETRNTGDVPLPYYAGHHFYFALPHGLRTASRLTLPPTLRCAQRSDGSISEPVAENAVYYPGDPQIQDQLHLLRQDAPQGTVTLEIPPLGRRIAIELATQPAAASSHVPWYAVTTWTESDTSDFYCVEPWLGLPNAIHHGQGLRWIPAGGIERASCTIVVTDDAVATAPSASLVPAT